MSWAQNTSTTKSNKSNTNNNFNVKVVDISDPQVQASIQEIERRGKNDTNRSLRQTTLDNALRQVVRSFGKKDSIEPVSSTPQKDAEQPSNRLDSESSEDPGDEGAIEGRSGSRIDLANLQFLMAVEDLLDSSSSDLVASALAEAASMHVDQLRSATRSFRTSLLESHGLARPTPSAQSSRESRSPPTEINTPPPTENNTPPAEIAAPWTPPELVNDLEQSTDSQTQPDAPTLTEATTLHVAEEASKASAEDSASEESRLTKQECMNQIQQIASSMSEVLESMKLAAASQNTDASKQKLSAEFSEEQEEELEEDYEVISAS